CYGSSSPRRSQTRSSPPTRAVPASTTPSTSGGAATDPPTGRAGVGRNDVAGPTIVFLHAHPDDETTQTSGSMARASADGDRVIVVYATNGDHGEAPE